MLGERQFVMDQMFFPSSRYFQVDSTPLLWTGNKKSLSNFDKSILGVLHIFNGFAEL